ncbi:PepSY domain-containing protein [Candidatus Avoscillospira sp. LCP25S3_F1]|uniref:PepSY domain-containing protein n=1 Tax=Candidatus Avoscillospira sp. LCP25S3_F1 TaxID=3438825 RepID=UPI003F90BE67
MKHRTIFRRLAPAALAVTLLMTSATPALAVTYGNAQVMPDRTIVVDGVVRTFYAINGQEVHPISYGGTTYLPVRSIGELMNKNVDWNNTTKTITLTSPRTTAAATGTPDINPQESTVSISLRDDFTIIVDGVVQQFYDAGGNRVYPLLYNGVTYLPIRAVGELMGKVVNWDNNTQTVTLSSSSGNSGNLVTDADSFGPGTGNTGNTGSTGNTGNTGNTGSIGNTGSTGSIGNTGSTGYITAETAKAKALAHAGLTASQVTFVRAYPDWEDGRYVYDVEFYTADYKEYDYEIDASTGAILSFDYDADYYTRPSQPSTGTSISAETAKAKALAHAGLSASQVTFVQATLDWDDGRSVYDVEFYTADYKEYDYEIDANTGAILSFDYDADHYVRPSQPATGTATGSDIGLEKAKSIALGQVSGASSANIRQAKRDYDDGRLEYDVTIIYNNLEYEFEINGATGTILSRDVESIWD